MGPEEKVIYLKPGASRTGATQGVFDQIRQLAAKRLGALLSNMLDHADDALFERAEKAESNTVQTEYFDAMRQVRLRRKEHEEAFQREVYANFRALLSSSARAVRTRGQSDDEDLRLVDNEALEEAIAIDSMAGKSRLRNNIALSQLTLRLEQLLAPRQVNADNNPLDPQQIAEAFARAAEAFDLEISARLVIFKLFDKHLMAELPGLYDEANGILIDVGILPDLKGPGAGMRRPAAPSASGMAAPAGVSMPAQEADPEAGQVFQILHQLLGKQKYGARPEWTGAGYSAPQGGAPAASLGDLLGALSQLQRDDHGPEVSDADLKAMLAQAFLRQAGRPKAIGRNEDDTIDIVGMLFEAILDDPQLPPSIKALIARLQIPVLKVALLDHSFFSSQQHPARQLINQMAQAAMGWVEPAQVERDPFYRHIDSVVDRVLTEFDQNVDLFRELLREFQDFLEEERERARLIEERTRQAAEGKAKVDGAKARVEAEIRARVAGRTPPAVVRTLLDEAWSKVLFITYLKEGEEGEGWQRQLNVLDRMLWSVEPKASAQERKNLLVEIPGLLHDLREGLNAILFNPFEMTRLFKELEAEHIRCLAASGEAAPMAPAPEADEPAAELHTVEGPMAEAPAAEAEQALAREPEPAVVAPVPVAVEPEPEPEMDVELAEYVGRLQDVPLGTWFEFTLSNASRIRAKLSARLAGGRRLIFVNRAGFKMADKLLEEAARELQAGAAVILDDNLLFDKALETVISNLRDMRAGQ